MLSGATTYHRRLYYSDPSQSSCRAPVYLIDPDNFAYSRHYILHRWYCAANDVNHGDFDCMGYHAGLSAHSDHFLAKALN